MKLATDGDETRLFESEFQHFITTGWLVFIALSVQIGYIMLWMYKIYRIGLKINIQ